MPIDQFAGEYLGLTVSYEKLSADGSICGLTAYADTEYEIREDGYIRRVPLKRNQVLLDASFILRGQAGRYAGRRRFTLAHECAHQILFQLESDEQKAAYQMKYAERGSYSLRDLKSREDWNEWQANVLGSAILMPQQDVIYEINRLTRGRRIKNYEGFFISSDRVVLAELSRCLEVSRSALIVRLRGLGFIEDLPYSEYHDPLEVWA